MMRANRRRLRACVIGASTGGIQAVRTILAGLAPRFRLAIIIVQHVAPGTQSLTHSYARATSLRVSEAAERQRIEPRHVYVAPAGYHLLIEKSERFALSVDEKVRWSRPSIDVTLESAADVWGPAVIGIVLTGANDDGARGLRCLRDRGGRAIVQDPQDAEMPVMPRAALELAGADEVLPLQDIALHLNRLAGAA